MARLRERGKVGPGMALGKIKSSNTRWTAVCFDAGRVTIAEIERGGAKPVVRACEGYALAGGVAETLKRLRKVHRLSLQRCVTLLTPGQYQLLQTELPGNASSMSREELREALRWRVKEMVDFPIERASVDLLEIPSIGNRPPLAWVVAASHDVLQPIIWQFQEAKIELAAIDIPETAQRNLAGLFEEANRALALLSFERQSSTLVITFRGELYLTRHIDIGAAGLPPSPSDALLERSLLDIQRTLDGFDRNFGGIDVARLIVGPLPEAEALPFLDYLRGNLSLPVVRANLAEVMDLANTPHLNDPQAQADAWLALGAALRD